MFEPRKFKVSSSAMASFVEGVLLIESTEYGERFTLNLKLEVGLKWSISPEWADDKRGKSFRLKPTLTDRNSSLTSSITRERYKRGGELVQSTK
jgi:hypothetical protein